MADGVALVFNLGELNRLGVRFRAGVDHLGDTRQLMDAIGAGLVASVIHRFENETGPDAVKWAPSLRALAEGGQTLTDRAHLRQSQTHHATRDQVAVGSNLIYARIHQQGGRAGRGQKVEIVARPYLGIDAGDERMIDGEVRDFLDGAFA